MLVLLNFAHPLTKPQIERIESLTGKSIERLIEINSQVDLQKPLGPQVAEMADRCGLSPDDWQTLPIVVNLPSLNFSSAALVAELHGRMGYFPTVVTLRRTNTTPPVFEVAEIVSLQAVRDQARVRR